MCVYLDEGFLTLDARLEAVLLDLNHEIPRLEVPGDGKGDVELRDDLSPLVGQSRLFLSLLGTSGGVFNGSRFCHCKFSLTIESCQGRVRNIPLSAILSRRERRR